jgi:hypothetical protein
VVGGLGLEPKMAGCDPAVMPFHQPPPGAHDWDRTSDLVLTEDAICQLMYVGLRVKKLIKVQKPVVGSPGELELGARPIYGYGDTPLIPCVLEMPILVHQAHTPNAFGIVLRTPGTKPTHLRDPITHLPELRQLIRVQHSTPLSEVDSPSTGLIKNTMAGARGFEPRTSVLETNSLPLAYTPAEMVERPGIEPGVSRPPA